MTTKNKAVTVGHFFDRRTATFLVLGAVLMALESWNNYQIVQAAKARTSPIQYTGKWVPDRKTYHPRETIRFSFHHAGGVVEPELATITISSFYDEEHNIPYEADVFAGVYQNTLSPSTVRRLPDNMKPSSHIVARGLVFAFGGDHTKPTPFCSEPFAVVSWGSERERAAADQ